MSAKAPSRGAFSFSAASPLQSGPDAGLLKLDGPFVDIMPTARRRPPYSPVHEPRSPRHMRRAPPRGKRSRVRLHLEMPFVLEPVSDVGDEDHEAEKHRQPEGDKHECGPAFPSGPAEEGRHQEHPAA